MKFSNLKTKPKILIGICSPLVLLLILGAISIFNISSIVNTNERVEHTQNVLGKAADIIGSAVDMETGMRGFLLAGKEEFLDPYKTGQKAFFTEMAKLQQTVSDNPPQVVRLKKAEQLIKDWNTQVTDPAIVLRRKVRDGQGSLKDIESLVAQAKGNFFLMPSAELLPNSLKSKLT